IADRIGSLRLLIYALLFFLFFSFLCRLASTFFFFNFFRFGCGVGAGFFYVLSRRLIFIYAPKSKLDMYSFLMTLCYAVVPVLGVCFGAWVAYESHWRFIFIFGEVIAFSLVLYFFFKKLEPEERKK